MGRSRESGPAQLVPQVKPGRRAAGPALRSARSTSNCHLVRLGTSAFPARPRPPGRQHSVPRAWQRFPRLALPPRWSWRRKGDLGMREKRRGEAGALLLHRAQSHGCPLPQGWQIQRLGSGIPGSQSQNSRPAGFQSITEPCFPKGGSACPSRAEMLLLAGFVTCPCPAVAVVTTLLQVMGSTGGSRDNCWASFPWLLLPTLRVTEFIHIRSHRVYPQQHQSLACPCPSPRALQPPCSGSPTLKLGCK